VDESDPIFIALACERLEHIVFQGFPYLVVHPTLGVSPIILLPRGLGEQSTDWIARQQRDANKLPVSLVLSADRIIVCQPHGARNEGSRIFVPGFPVSGKLEACVSFPQGGELAVRARALEEFVAEHNPGGYLVGSGWRGSRVATLDEAQWLFGRGGDGVPRGLERCPECGDWRGECLDPRRQEQLGKDVVVSVSCACENWNRCARCHETLAPHRLNSNFYDPRDGKIWFVPGFSGLNHLCPEQR
jgi:hypothetical protein